MRMENAVVLFMLLALFFYRNGNEIRMPDKKIEETVISVPAVRDDERTVVDGVKVYEEELTDWEKSVDWEFVFELKNVEFLDDMEPIITNEEAVEIGKSFKETNFSTMELCAVVHYTQDNIWWFQYGTEASDPWDSIVGGCVDVVLDGNTCEILAAWPGE